MATTYSMQITGIQIKYREETLQNVVTAVTYDMFAVSDDGIRKAMAKQIPTPLTSGSTFIPVEDITEEIVTEWVLNSPDYLTDEDKRIFEIRFVEEREKQYTNCYNFSFLTGSTSPYVYN